MPPSAVKKKKPRLQHDAKKLFSWKDIVVLGAMVLWAYNFRWVERQLPFLLTAQLRVHQILSNLDWHQKRVESVTLIQIDDESYWSPPFSGVEPTNRAALGDLGVLAAEHGAQVVAFDVKPESLSLTKPRDDSSRDGQNQHFTDSLSTISKAGKLVVLASGLVWNDEQGWRRHASIFMDDRPPLGARFGHINLPIDPRQIPLAVPVLQGTETAQIPLDSFALAITDSYEEVAHIRPRTTESQVITQATAEGQFVYGGFLKNSAWDPVSATKLLHGDVQALKMCCNHIVIIGSTWHKYGDTTNGPLEDEHLSPLGLIPGLYLQGNYVEALLRGDYRPGVPEKYAVLIDLVIAILFYILFRSANKGRAQAGVLLTFIFLLLAAYLMFANVGRYLDFVTPVSLVFVHLLVEAF